ncbi:caspase, EACC1-associated type [Fischerella sp. PCC 9605]|uniref:caspase, EACC1-associated type n=1 Tax=Fischerella sp. PCC 9605 TaxID=1173024 RepID=UPI0004AC6637|nr:tetratricopeptide repeat protein [Fischerella sp. PCC 9605]
MVKVALLIGVSEYEEPSLNPLKGASKDVEAMQRVLQNSGMGGFDEVRTLPDPNPLAMQEAIETLFSDRAKDDLVLLFFSGHGIKDESGRLYFATRITRKNKQGELIKATAVPATFVQDIMSNSRSKRQVVILDCCFSGAFAEGWVAKDDGSVDVKNILGGEGRAVLTSSTSTQYSFEQQESDLSIYTRYLVEGIETGAADQGNDGVISVDELHEYAKKKVREAAPAMKPEIYAIKEGYKIHVAKASIGDPRLRYRKEVERFADRGEISFVGRSTLDLLRETFGLLHEDAVAIEAEVLKPYQDRKRKLQRYEQVLVEAILRESPLSEETRNDLQHLQKVLGLRDEDVAPIEARILVQKESLPFSDQLPESNKTPIISPNEDSISAKSSEKAAAANQAETPELNNGIRFPHTLSPSVPVSRNKIAIIGAGIVTVLILTFYSLIKPHENSVTSQPSPAASPTQTVSSTPSPTPTMTAKEIYDRGLEKYNNSDYKAAIKDFTQAMQLNYSNVIVYYQRGYAFNQLENYKAAVEDLTEYLKFNPNDVDANRSRCRAYYNLDNYEQAITDCSKVIKISSQDAYAHYLRGRAYEEQGKYELAIGDYSKAIELNYDPLSFAYFRRGYAYNRLGDYKKSINDYSQTIRIDASDADAYYNRGNNRSKLKDKQGAIADYQKAAELYQKQGKTKDYQETLDKIKELQQ